MTNIFLHYRNKRNLASFACFVIIIELIFILVFVQSNHFTSIANSIFFQKYEGNFKQRFLAVRFFAEQLGMCQYHLINFIEVAYLLNAKPVAPITCDSRLCTINGKYCHCLYTSESLRCTKRPNRLGRFCPSNISLFSIYDKNTLQADLQASHLPQLKDLDTFMTRSHRSLILIHPIYLSYSCSTCYESLGGNIVAPLLQNASIIECSFVEEIAEIQDDFLTTLNKLAIEYDVENFKVFATYCIRSWAPYDGNNLIREWKIKDNTSVVLTTWRGLINSGGIRTRINNVPSFNKMPVDGLKVSKLVTTYTRRFLQIVTSGRPFIGIQMRSEHFRFIIRDKFKRKLLWKCFSMISKIRKKLQDDDPDLTSLHFWDLGQWGSAFDNFKIDGIPMQNLIEQTVLENGTYQINEYNPLIYGGPDDAGFASLVETETVSEAKYLIVIGGGSYQARIVKTFIRKNSNSNNVYNLKYCNLRK